MIMSGTYDALEQMDVRDRGVQMMHILRKYKFSTKKDKQKFDRK